MKKIITILTAVIMVLAVLTSCSQPNSSGTIVNKGSLESIEFNAPGKLSVIDYKIEKYALIDHEYTTEDYSIMAVYSSGYKENVTASAKIEGSSIKSSKGNLTFLSGNKDGHKYTVNVSYGGKTTSAVVYAYKVGDIMEKNIKQSKIFTGASLADSGIAKIMYMTDSGNMTSLVSLPKTGTAKIYDSTGTLLTSGPLNEIRAVKDGDAKISYSVYKDSEVIDMSIDKVLPLTEVKNIKTGAFSKYPEEGETINLNDFVKTYMKNYRVQLWNSATSSEADVKSVVYITDSNGNVTDGYKITVTVSRPGTSSGSTENITSGNFKKGDVIKVLINITNSSVEGVKEYTI